MREINLKVCTAKENDYRISREYSEETAVLHLSFARGCRGEAKIYLGTPLNDIFYSWTPVCGVQRTLAQNRSEFETAMVSDGMPCLLLLDGSGNCAFSWTLGDCANQFLYNIGINEEEAAAESIIKFRLDEICAGVEYELEIRCGTRRQTLAKELAAICAYLQKKTGALPAKTPACAYDPIYSFWYSYHQKLTANEVLKECKMAKELGFNTCIVDDGWQTEDTARGYAFCGDWQPAPAKFPDMRTHIAQVHAVGMKYILWYSVPFVGFQSMRFEELSDCILRYEDELGAGVLDPRYKKVRDFLAVTYEHALRQWDVDGFKLDFVDQWHSDDKNAPANDNMDIPSLPEAVYTLMREITERLTAVKSDIMIEFRQRYIGVYMQACANMLRVADCPGDIVKNRAGVLDLRMLASGAVHSDMLMWHRDERPENAARAIIGVMFGVPQLSVRIGELTAAQRSVVKFWLGFINEHREALYFGELCAYDPQLFYTWAKSAKDGVCIAAVYAGGRCIKPDSSPVIYIANGSEDERVIFELCGRYAVQVYDCTGGIVRRGECCFNGLGSVDIPVGGVARLMEEIV